MRILVVDPHSVVAEALAARLAVEPDVEAAEAVTDASALSTADVRQVDVLLVDAALAGPAGFDLVRRARSGLSEVRVVVLTAHDEPTTALESLLAGASAVVGKAARVEDLLVAVRGVARGETHVSPQTLTGVVGHLKAVADRRRELEQRLARLTTRERGVLAALATGMRASNVAEHLGVSAHTLRTHRKRILAKLEVHSTVEAVSLAVSLGLRAPAPGDGDPAR